MSTVSEQQVIITATGLTKVRALLERTDRSSPARGEGADLEARSFLARFREDEISSLVDLARSGTLFSAMNRNFGSEAIDPGKVRGDAVLGPYLARFTDDDLLDIHKAMLAKKACGTV